MNPNLTRLLRYPFERLSDLKHGLTGPVDKPHIAWSIGEPKHPAPEFVAHVLAENLAGLGAYPPTKGLASLREAICHWAIARYELAPDGLNPEQQVLPVSGTREALFAFAQTVVDGTTRPQVLMPNPFYQIYEGAALLAGAEPYYLNCEQSNDFVPDLDAVPESVWQRCQLIYVCTPGNPTGAVLSEAFFKQLLELADRYDFVIASDECYSEIYLDETAPPLGLLQACARLGRDDFSRCMVFNSLSKRSSLPGLRSGFVAGDANLIRAFLLYRTYHGCALSLIAQAVSTAAWSDEAHVVENRQRYQTKFRAVVPILEAVMDVQTPPAGFFLWPQIAGTDLAGKNDYADDEDFTRRLFQQQHVTVLPGSYLARDTVTGNPGRGRVRMALVAPLSECIEAAQRIKIFIEP
ncbi:MAG: succinyldiaminopimelate transaminase [Gammaproteobacteria bacterium]